MPHAQIPDLPPEVAAWWADQWARSVSQIETAEILRQAAERFPDRNFYSDAAASLRIHAAMLAGV